MMWINRCVVLILLYHLQLTLAQVNLGLTGSCIQTGLTECCPLECQALDGPCYCDDICLTALDCCRDIYQLDVCVNFAGTECTSGSVRLVGGLRPYEGLVEVCIFQSWHPVCNTSFSYPEALVTCNHLGYSATLDSHTNTIQLLDNTTVLNRTAYGPNCSGNEPRLTECIVDFRYCVSGDEQATVQCIPIDVIVCDPPCVNGACEENNQCDCMTGWTGIICDNEIDECLEGLHNCSNETEICINTFGSFECQCISGYMKDSGLCNDINECNVLNGGCSDFCNNTNGSYYCSCPVGYELVNELLCKDIDECSNSSLNDCDQICMNNFGSFMCQCRDGYELVNNSCIAQQCIEVLSSPSNGVLECNSSVQVTHTRCNTICDIGYEVVGSVVRICQPDGTWSGESAYCQPLRCPTLFPPINGYVQLPCTPLYDSECIVRCFDGFELVNGNGSVRCDLDENNKGMVQWTEYGVCNSNINECDTANGGCSHYCNNTDGSYFCSCPVGYELSGTLICQAKQCVEVLTSASNGVLQCTSSVQVTHTRCNTSCDIGYEVVGSAVRICQPDGTWSGESAYCQPLRCPTLFPPINGYVQLPCTPLYDSECFVRCFDGFELVNGNDSVRCDIDKNDEEMVKWTEYGVCKKNSLTYLTTTTGTSESLSTYPSATVTPTETSVNCSSPGQIRLVDGYHQFDGRVEICINGEWGTVCNDLWDYNDAKVVCRQLGHSEVDAKAYNNSYFGEDVGQSKLHQVDCVGDESALLDCRHAINSYDCFHYQAAGVECKGRCSYYGELRLVGGDSENEGRVEICINGEWGTVCDDSWDNDDAKVVCRQLGYSTNGALGQQGAHYGEGTGKIHLDELGCSGNESDLLLCSHLPVGVHDCEHKEDAGVRCPHTSSYMESAPLPGAQVAGITVGAVVIVISMSTVFAILVMCYKYRKRLREKNIDLRNQDSTSPEKLHVQENIAYCQVVRHHPAPIYSTISEVVQSPNVFGSENDYEIMF